MDIIAVKFSKHYIILIYLVHKLYKSDSILHLFRNCYEHYNVVEPVGKKMNKTQLSWRNFYKKSHD